MSKNDMKTKIIIIAVIVVAIVAAIVVKSMVSGNKNVGGTLEEIMEKLYKNIPAQNLPMMLGNIEVDAENIEYYIGRSDIKFKEALANESMTGSIAHSIVLLRLEDAKDAADVVAKIKESANPRKWICVEASNVAVKSKGNLVMLIMTNESLAPSLEANFNSL